MKQLSWHTEQRKVSDLIPYEKNPRFLTPDQELKLVESLKKFSLVEIPAIDTDNTLIAGHQRVTVLLKLGRGEEMIDVRVPNRKLTKVEFDEYNIRSNANTGSWDMEMLKLEFDMPSLEEWGLDLTKMKGFGDTEGGVEEEKPLPEVSSKIPIIKNGDVFKLGNHKLLCGNSKSQKCLELLMGDSKAQMIFTDPPYNVRIKDVVNFGVIKHKEFAEASGELTSIEFVIFLKDVFAQLSDNSCDGSIHFVCMDWKHMEEIILAGKDFFQLKQLVVWVKDSGGMGTFYRSQHELIFVFKKGQSKHINNFELGQNGRYRTNVWDSETQKNANKKGAKTNVWRYSREKYDLHPTVKPVKMVSDAILDCSHRGGLVLDAFLGSGTTIIAAENTARVCYGVELDEAYCEVIVRRYHNYMQQQGKPTVFEHLNGELTLEQILENA